jgi:SAM-dependent methyltransferase
MSSNPHVKFDVAKLEKLNHPGRLEQMPPGTLWDALAVGKGATLVEIGAGTGVFAAEFIGIEPTVTVYAADVEPAMVEWMLRNRPEVLAGHLVPVLSHETGTPLAPGIADGVFMIALHHELADPGNSYRDSARLLKPGGRILVVDWIDRETEKGPPVAVRASAEQLAAHLADAGFTDVRIHPPLAAHSVVTASKPVRTDV